MTAVARPGVAPPEPLGPSPRASADDAAATASRSSPTTSRASTSSRCASGCPCSLRASRASVRASPRSWRARSTRAPRSTRPRSSPSCSSARASRFGAGMAEAGLSVDVDVAKRHLEPALDLLRQTLTEPAFPEAEVARHVAHPARRDRAGARGRRRTGRRSSSSRTLLRRRTSARRARPRARARRVAAITREDVVGLPRRARRRRRASPSSSPATSTGLDVRASRRGAPSAAGTRARRASARLERRGALAPRPRPHRLRRPARLGADRARPGGPGSGPARRRRLGALPGAGLRARRLAQRPHRRGAARGEGLHLRHPVGLPAASPRGRVPHLGLGARRRDGGVARACSSTSSRRGREGFTDERDPAGRRLHQQDRARAATPRPTRSPTRR